jgi:hypothetical protein
LQKDIFLMFLHPEAGGPSGHPPALGILPPTPPHSYITDEHDDNDDHHDHVDGMRLHL